MIFTCLDPGEGEGGSGGRVGRVCREGREGPWLCLLALGHRRAILLGTLGLDSLASGCPMPARYDDQIHWLVIYKRIRRPPATT